MHDAWCIIMPQFRLISLSFQDRSNSDQGELWVRCDRTLLCSCSSALLAMLLQHRFNKVSHTFWDLQQDIRRQQQSTALVVVSNVFYFHPYLPTWGNDQIWPSYGWFNHQLVVRFPSAISSWSKFARKPKLREELEEKVKAQHEQNHPKSTKMFKHSYLGWSLFPVSCDHPGLLLGPIPKLDLQFATALGEGLGREAVAVHGANSIYRHPMEFRRQPGVQLGVSLGKSTEIEFLPGWNHSNLPALLLRWGKMAPFYTSLCCSFFCEIQLVITLDPLKNLAALGMYQTLLNHVRNRLRKLSTRTAMVQDIVHEKLLFLFKFASSNRMTESL